MIDHLDAAKIHKLAHYRLSSPDSFKAVEREATDELVEKLCYAVLNIETQLMGIEKKLTDLAPRAAAEPRTKGNRSSK